MNRLTQDRRFQLHRAGRLLAKVGHVLADFEHDLVADLGGRFAAHGDAMTATDSEWEVFDTAVEAMSKRLRTPVTIAEGEPA